MYDTFEKEYYECVDDHKGRRTMEQTIVKCHPEEGWNKFEPWHATDRIIGCYPDSTYNYAGFTQNVIPLISSPLPEGCCKSSECIQQNKPGPTEKEDLKIWGLTAKYGWNWDTNRYRYYCPGFGGPDQQ